LRPGEVSSEGEEYFEEEVVGLKIERGRELFSIKWAGFNDDFITWENGAENGEKFPMWYPSFLMS
jgi:hypothetical protein